MLGGTAALLVARHGLAAGPAIWGAVAALAGALCVGALAMTASLWIGRAAVLLLVVLGIPFVVFANAAMFAGALFELEVGGLTASVTRFAPPLGLAVIAAVAPWNPHVELGDELAPLWRLGAWALGSVALLVLAFRRTEIR